MIEGCKVKVHFEECAPQDNCRYFKDRLEFLEIYMSQYKLENDLEGLREQDTILDTLVTEIISDINLKDNEREKLVQAVYDIK